MNYLDIVNTHDAPTVIHVLLQVFFLMKEKGREGVSKEERVLRFSDCLLHTQTKHGHIQSTDTHQVLKYECQALVSVDNVMESDNIGVLQVFQQRH